MIYKKVFYSLKNNNFFKVQFDTKTIMVAANQWESFLNQYGTNLKPKGKRIAGSDSVVEQALIDFISKLNSERGGTIECH